jgi:hypothetical protein
MATTDFEGAFHALKSVFEPFLADGIVQTDEPGKYYLASPLVLKGGKPVWLGGVEIKKSYVSLHFMPFYIRPAMLEGSSEALLRRMQGKACFNFKAPDPALIQELKDLVAKAAESLRTQPVVFP